MFNYNQLENGVNQNSFVIQDEVNNHIAQIEKQKLIENRKIEAETLKQKIGLQQKLIKEDYNRQKFAEDQLVEMAQTEQNYLLNR